MNNSGSPAAPTARIFDLKRHAARLGRVWIAMRLVYIACFAFFISVYHITVVPQDYELTDRALIAQPIALGGLVMAWLSTARTRAAYRLSVIVIVAFFAWQFAQVRDNSIANPAAIDEWSRRFPDQRFDAFLRGLHPAGPVILFLTIYAAFAAFLLRGAYAALQLRWRRIPGLERSLSTVDRELRDSVAGSGDAPALIRQLNLLRARAWLLAALSAIVLLLPFVLIGGREWQIPGTPLRVQDVLPEALARLLVAATDRWQIMIPALVIAAALWRWARRYWMPAGAIAISLDQRPPIVLLRSFRDDAKAVAPSALWARALLWRRRLEEAAAVGLRDIGPFVALADPRDDAPSLGAIRVPLAGSAWRAAVTRYIETARAVVMIAGTTEAVSWELRQIIASGAVDRLVLLIPPAEPWLRLASRRGPNVAERWANACDCFAGTPWHASLVATDPRGVLAVTFDRGGEICLVAGKRRERDYDLAVRIAVHRVIVRAAGEAQR